jgi:hypothetical protein
MDWEPTVQEQRYIDLYDRSHQPEMTGKQTVAAMRKSGQGIINDARKPETQAGATGGRPLRQPGASPLGFEGDKGWKSRQDALGVAPRVIVGDLQPGEIQFLERLQAINPDLPLSQQVEWLPLGERVNGQRQPSNDFVWIDHGGIEVELKSPVRNSPGSVIPRIWKAVNTAWDRHEFVKSNFIVDLGEQEFPDALREALAAYNLTRSGPEITSVFVMWQGKIEEIALKQR